MFYKGAPPLDTEEPPFIFEMRWGWGVCQFSSHSLTRRGFEDKHWDVLKSTKKMAAIAGVNEKQWVDELMEKPYPPKN